LINGKQAVITRQSGNINKTPINSSSLEDAVVVKELDKDKIIQLSYYAISQEHVKSIG
jgi:hypothetical protein